MLAAAYIGLAPERFKETAMMNDLPPELSHDEAERNAYNAAFYALGLRWHWDAATYAELRRHSPKPEIRLRHFLETRHPHLLKAYDADFLAAAVRERMATHKPCMRPFDWSQAAGLELGI
jgi:hypothetical protein